MKILGVDPGSTRIGYGIIEDTAGLSCRGYGVLEIAPGDKAAQVAELTARFRALVAEVKPDAAGLEKLYFSKNQKTALRVAESRGVIHALLVESGVPVYECSPAEAKIAATNSGSADKAAVSRMVGRVLRLRRGARYDDATDALAIALATLNHYAYTRSVGRGRTN